MLQPGCGLKCLFLWRGERLHTALSSLVLQQMMGWVSCNRNHCLVFWQLKERIFHCVLKLWIHVFFRIKKDDIRSQRKDAPGRGAWSGTGKGGALCPPPSSQWALRSAAALQVEQEFSAGPAVLLYERVRIRGGIIHYFILTAGGKLSRFRWVCVHRDTTMKNRATSRKADRGGCVAAAWREWIADSFFLSGSWWCH